MVPLLLLCVASLFGSTRAALCNPKDQCAKLTDGLYCPVNNVKEHGDINRDVKKISEHLGKSTPDYTSAKNVYENGLESSKGSSKRTLKSLAQKDMTVGGKYTNVFYSGALDLYGTINAVWHDPIMACFAATGICQGKDNSFRKYIINKGLIGVVSAYVTYEMGAAVWKADNASQTTDAGAPYAWDEAAAFYVGNIKAASGDGRTGKAPGNLYSPYEFAWKRDSDYPAGTVLHTAALPIFNYGLINLRGTYNQANVATAQKAIYKIISIAAIRSAIKYAAKAYNNGTFVSKYVAEGWAYWRSASGYLSTINKATVQEIDALFAWNQTSMSSAVPCQVKSKVESLYSGLGIKCTDVGTYKDASKYGGCTVACSSSSTGTLSSGSSAYVDMCKTGSTNTASMAPDASQLSLAAMSLAAAASTQCFV
jgi:hypothetical protein